MRKTVFYLLLAGLILAGCTKVKETELSGIHIAVEDTPEMQTEDVPETQTEYGAENPTEYITENQIEYVTDKETKVEVIETSAEQSTIIETESQTQSDEHIGFHKISAKLTASNGNMLIIDANVTDKERDDISSYSYSYIPYDFNSIIHYVRPDIADSFVTYDASIMSPKKYVAKVNIDGIDSLIEATDAGGYLSMNLPVIVSAENPLLYASSDRYAPGCSKSIDECRKKAEDIRQRFYKGKWDSYEERIFLQDCVKNEYSKSGGYSYRYFCKGIADDLDCFDYTSGGNVSDYFSISFRDEQVAGMAFSTLALNKINSGRCISVDEAVSYLNGVIELYKDWALGTITEVKLQYLTSYDEHPNEMIPCWVFYDNSFGGVCFGVNAIDGSVLAFCHP